MYYFRANKGGIILSNTLGYGSLLKVLNVAREIRWEYSNDILMGTNFLFECYFQVVHRSGKST